MIVECRVDPSKGLVKPVTPMTLAYCKLSGFSNCGIFEREKEISEVGFIYYFALALRPEVVT